MRMKRRNFIKSSLVAGAALAVPEVLMVLANAEAEPQTRPWDALLFVWEYR